MTNSERENAGSNDFYENSFITSGVIESQISEKKDEIDQADIPGKNDDEVRNKEKNEQISSRCPECGKETDISKTFCMFCGSGLSESDRVKKIAKQVIPNMEDKTKSVTTDYYRKTTEELKEEYPETINNIEAIAKEVGFKNLYVKDFDTEDIVEGRSKNLIHVEMNNYGKDAVFFPKEFLKNHQLLEELDKERTNIGLKDVMEHEKEHCEDFAKKASNSGKAVT